MNGMTNQEAVKNQYATSRNLEIRISLHQKYSVNKQGFGNWILEQYKLKPGDKILELGCGNGAMWEGKTASLPKEASLILSDYSQGMVDVVTEKFKDLEEITIKRIDITDIPYEMGTFDVVIANMMLYHVPDLQKALSEVKRVLKKDGTFYSATFGENGVAPYLMRELSLFVEKKTPDSFTLQNGQTVLEPYFSSIRMTEYEDHLEVTDPADLADYVLSTISIRGYKNVTREGLIEYFKSKMENGVIYIPKEYGMFISTNQG